MQYWVIIILSNYVIVMSRNDAWILAAVWRYFGLTKRHGHLIRRH